MQIRRFFAVDSDTALRIARDELGEHMLVLNLTERNGGFEVIATADSAGNTDAMPFSTLFGASRDDNPIADDVDGREQRMRRSLRELGLSSDVIDQLLAPGNRINFATPQLAIRDVMSTLAATIPVSRHALLDGRQRLVIHGSAGSGRTTTLAKLARMYCIHYDASQLAVIDADPHGPVDGGILQSLADQRGISLYRIDNMQELPETLAACDDKAMVLIAPPALTQRALRDGEPLLDAASLDTALTQVLTIPADKPVNVLRRLLQNARPLGITASIVTRVDSDAGLGAALSVSIEQQLPIAFWSDGEDVSSHLYPANGRHLVEKTVAILKALTRSQPQREEQLGDLHLLM